MAVELSSIVLRGYNPRKASAFATLTSAKSAVNQMVLSETFQNLLTASADCPLVIH